MTIKTRSPRRPPLAVTTAQIIVAFSFAVIATIVASHLYDPFAALAFPSLIIVYESELFGLHFVLECIAAGFVVENFSNHGDELIKAVERTSMTVYVVFFALAGASIDFGILHHS